MILNDVKPPLSEVVEHFGVVGMHWGQRKTRVTTAEIKAARSTRRVQKSIIKSVEKAKKNPNDERSKEILASISNRKISAVKRQLRDHPNRATALRFTKGQKYVTAFMLARGAAGAAIAVAIGAPAALAVASVAGPVIGTSAAIGYRKRVERSQTKP